MGGENVVEERKKHGMGVLLPEMMTARESYNSSRPEDLDLAEARNQSGGRTPALKYTPVREDVDSDEDADAAKFVGLERQGRREDSEDQNISPDGVATVMPSTPFRTK